MTTGAASCQPRQTVSLIFIRVCAALIGLRSLTNLAKLFQGNEAVLVFFGQILHGGDAAVPALGVGLFMLVTAIAMWRPFKWAFPLAVAYAAYVAVNLIAWTLTNPEQLQRVGMRVSSATDHNELQWLGAVAMLGYSLVAIATTAGPAWILWKRRATEWV